MTKSRGYTPYEYHAMLVERALEEFAEAGYNTQCVDVRYRQLGVCKSDMGKPVQEWLETLSFYSLQELIDTSRRLRGMEHLVSMPKWMLNWEGQWKPRPNRKTENQIRRSINDFMEALMWGINTVMDGPNGEAIAWTLLWIFLVAALTLISALHHAPSWFLAGGLIISLGGFFWLVGMHSQDDSVMERHPLLPLLALLLLSASVVFYFIFMDSL